MLLNDDLIVRIRDDGERKNIVIVIFREEFAFQPASGDSGEKSNASDGSESRLDR